MKNLLKPLNKSGDTIVEVLIAMAVVAVVLGGAYTSANRSLNSTRAAQERGEALKFGESQAEALSTLAGSTTISENSIFNTDNNVFCVPETTYSPVHFNSYDPSTANLADTDFSKYPDQCKFDRYNTSITYDTSNPDSRGFRVLVRWERVNGGRDEISMYYRVPKPLASASTPLAPPPPPPDDGATADVTRCSDLPPTDPKYCSPSTNTLHSYYRWFYNAYLINRSVPPTGASVMGCTWDWADGSGVDTRACNYNDGIGHCYLSSVPYPPYSPSNHKKFTVLLTERYSNGSTGIRTYDLYPPYRTQWWDDSNDLSCTIIQPAGYAP
jgi:type II secretory pathway pseudopilin PulG